MEKVYAQIISVSLMLTTLCGAGLNMRCTNSIIKELLETVENTAGECKEELAIRGAEKTQNPSAQKPAGFLKNAFARVSAELSKFCKRCSAKRYTFDCRDIAAQTINESNAQVCHDCAYTRQHYCTSFAFLTEQSQSRTEECGKTRQSLVTGSPTRAGPTA